MEPARPASPPGFAPETADFYLADPDAAFAALRRDDPLHWYEAARFWCVTKHADVQEVGRRPRDFCSSRGTQMFQIAVSHAGREELMRQELAGPTLASAPNIISIAAVGDIMLGSPFPDDSRMPPKDGAEMLDEVAPILSAADIAFGNMEAPIIDSGIRPRNPAAVKPLEPGAANRARYGLGTGSPGGRLTRAWRPGAT